MDNYEKKNRQLENLENLVENHTRTKRHLEQYSNIGDKGSKENARDIQKIREKQIKLLESKIKDEDKYISPEEHLENIKEKYISTENYIKNNRESMNDEMLKNMQAKQKHREEQINFIEDES